MSVYVKDATEPKNCTGCIAVHYYMSMVGDAGMLCEVTGLSMDDYYSDGRPDWYPLIEVPEPHGRLGDLDALAKQVEHERFHSAHTDGLAKRHHVAEYGNFLKAISAAPTIIPASEEIN